METETNFHDPLAVANSALGFFKNRNLPGLIGLFNEANRSVLSQGKSGKFRRDIFLKLEVSSKTFENVDKIRELREICRDDSWNFHAVGAKVKQERHLIHVFALTKEEGKYKFDSLITPFVSEYDKWEPFPKIAPFYPDEKGFQKSFEKRKNGAESRKKIREFLRDII